MQNLLAVYLEIVTLEGAVPPVSLFTDNLIIMLLAGVILPVVCFAYRFYSLGYKWQLGLLAFVPFGFLLAFILVLFLPVRRSKIGIEPPK